MHVLLGVGGKGHLTKNNPNYCKDNTGTTSEDKLRESLRKDVKDFFENHLPLTSSSKLCNIINVGLLSYSLLLPL